MRNVKPVKVKDLTFDGKKIYIQSMLNIPAHDIEGNVKQAKELEKIGCDIIRTAVPDKESVSLITALKENVNIPVVADIHFDYRLAIMCAERGADKIRINPGNIGSADRIKAVTSECKKRNIPIRIGVNSGSLEKKILEKYGAPTAEALCESALYHVKLLEENDFDDIVVSIKSSDVKTMIEAYRLFSEKSNYPLHLGVTEAGTKRMGIIKSSVGIGSLLCDNIGETIRVSLTDDPKEEIYAAKDILKAIGKGNGVKIISCPTCGRTEINLAGIAKEVEDKVKDIDKNITVAVMGCIVNGPGEAREADVGAAGGKGCGIIFRKGEIIKKVKEDEIVSSLMEEIEKL